MGSIARFYVVPAGVQSDFRTRAAMWGSVEGRASTVIGALEYIDGLLGRPLASAVTSLLGPDQARTLSEMLAIIPDDVVTNLPMGDSLIDSIYWHLRDAATEAVRRGGGLIVVLE